MFRLLRYFSITSLIAFITVAVVLGKVYRRTAVSALISMGENHNVALTQAFANSLWPKLEPYVNASSGKNGDTLRADPQLPVLFKAVTEQMKDTVVVKVKVYNLEGLTVFSTEASQIGEYKSDNRGFQLAASGTTVSELTHRKTFSSFEKMTENIDVISSYIPIQQNDQTRGVFEIYTEITPLLQKIKESQLTITLSVIFIFALLYLILFLIVRRADSIIIRQYKDIKHAEEQAMLAKEAADSLLLNILPLSIVEKLKHSSSTIADTYQDATVLFVDIVDFTRLTAHADPEDLVDFLNNIFSAFDGLAQKYGLEKIKTIGDAYMVAGGVPVPRDDHAEAVANMALDIMEVMSDFTWNGERIFFRIGINSGPVIAGVIGRQKFIYDLWGDSVNIASRMESSSMPGVIQVTQSTYDKLKTHFLFEKRETIYVKGRGEMQTYFLRDHDHTQLTEPVIT